VRETSDGGFVVAGSQSPLSTPVIDVFLMKTDGSGTAQWKKRFAWPGGAQAFGVRQTADGGYIVVGGTLTSGNRDVYLLKTDASGNALDGWPRTYSSSGSFDDTGYDVLPISGGTAGYLVVGSMNVYDPYGSNPNIFALRTDASGNPLAGWPKFYSTDNTANEYGNCGIAPEAGRAVAEVSGGYVIAGYTGCGWSGILLKIDVGGVQQWIRRYGPSATVSEWFESVAATPGGDFVVAGYRGLLSGQPPVMAPHDALVVKTDAAGNELWRRSYGLAETDMAFGVALTLDAQGAPDGGHVVTGFTQSFGGPVDPAVPFMYQDVYLIKVDADGNALWQKVKGNRPTSSDLARGVAAVSDGGIVVTGSSGGNVLLAKFDKNGDTINLGATDLSVNVPVITGIIDFGNALDVAVAGVRTLTLPRQVGATAFDLLLANLRGDAVSAFCNGGGSYSFTPAPAVPLAGKAFTLTLSDCITGPGGDLSTLSGSVQLAVDAASGDVLSTDYSVNTTLATVSITVTESGGTLTQTIAGGLRFERVVTGGNIAEVARSIDSPATTLTATDTDASLSHTVVMGPFAVSATRATGGDYSYGAATDSATVNPDSRGPMALTVLAPVLGSGTADPASGQVRMLASDNSRLTMTITSGTASLAVDTDGDGVDDGTVAYPWEFIY
jgi:hypothetical protein